MRKRLGDAGVLSDDRRTVAVFQEAGRIYRANNPRDLRILRYRVDGQMIRNGERCDFLMGIPERESIYLVELKGADLKKAASQILATLRRLRERISAYQPNARVVLSRVQRPAVTPPTVLELQRVLAKCGGRLRYASQTLSESLE